MSFAQNKDLKIKDAYNLLEKSKKYKSLEKEDALNKINKAIEITKYFSNKKLLAESYYLKSKILDYNEEYAIAQKYYALASYNFIKIKDSLNTAKCFNNIGVTYYFSGNFDSAFVSYNKASKYLETLTEYSLHAKIENNLGLINKAKGNYEDAIKNFHKCIKLNELDNNEIKISNSYQNIGILYWEQENYDEALKCFNTATKILEKNNETKDLGDLYNNIGLIYKAKNDTTNAILYYEKAITSYSQTNNKRGLGAVLLNKGVLLDEKGFINEAKTLFSHSLKLFEEINYAPGIFICKINLSKIYSDKNINSKALKFAKEAILLDSIDKPIKYVSDAYFVLAKTYTNIKDYQSANIYLNKYLEIKDSLFTLEKNKQINQLHTKFETEKKENKIKLLEKDSKIQALEIESKTKKIRTITISLIIIILFAIISIILYIQKRASFLLLVKQNVELAKSDIEKEKSNLENKAQQNSNSKRYSETNLDKEKKQELLHNITTLMEEEKYYLNSQFTINDFAKKLNSNRNYLSQIINEFFNTNFNNFVNEYRVKEARKLLLDSENNKYTIEGIAHSVGFHSKTSFNNSFKKFTGVTPSFFRRNAHIS